MGRHNRQRQQNGHGIRLPGAILDEIRANGDSTGKTQQSRGPERKDQRKQQDRQQKRKRKTERTESDDEWFGDSDREAKGGNEKDVMAQLKAAKANKNKNKNESMSAEGTMQALKNKKKRKDDNTDERSAKRSKKAAEAKRPIASQDKAAMAKDEEEMAYYAKKLGMKNWRLSQADDGLDDLLGDLDFENYADGSESEESEGEMTKYNKMGSRDEDEDGDDLDEDELAELEEMEGLDSEDDDEDKEEDDDEDDDSGEDNDEAEEEKPMKENPYVAPVASSTKYIPPSKRAAMAAAAGQNAEDSEELMKLRRQVKGLLNRLSEQNIGSIINELESLYRQHPRNHLNRVITEIIIEGTAMQGTLQEQFLIVHATLATALYRTIGVEFGAYFVQTLVERFERACSNANGKEASNLLSMITEIYTFQLVSCKLMYDFIKSFLDDVDEAKTGYLLKVVLNSGPQLRSDDPAALKEIIYMLQVSVAKLGQQNVSKRMEFLIDSIKELKDNRQKKKLMSETVTASVQRMKKFLGAMGNVAEPLQVTLDDIRNVETRGKWWLVGAAWNNRGIEKRQVVDQHALDDILGSADTNWLELAKQQRMNTDIRRAIFVSLMSSEDYVDASDRLAKLSLKNKQEREIPKVILHCCSTEDMYNPFYSLVAGRLCSRSRSLKKTFQFQLWDYLSELEEEDGGTSLQKTTYLARLFAHLVSEGFASLDVLKPIDFLTGNAETKIFIEVFLVSLYQGLGKKAEGGASNVNQGFGRAMFETKRDPNVVNHVLVKTKNELVLKGVKVFQKHNQLAQSDIITKNRKKGRERVQWCVDVVDAGASSVIKMKSKRKDGGGDDFDVDLSE